jgi:hypothetical protein
MSTQGKAAKSASGAAMSKYDVEVEARLQALESQVNSKSSDETSGDLESKVDAIIAILKSQWPAKFSNL